MNETTVTVVGNIATDMSSKRIGTDQHLLVGFRVASSARRFDRASESWTDGDRFSAWVSCWRKLGEGVAGSLVKGDPVVVTGRLSVREYEVNGERRFSTEIAATSVGPDLARSTAAVARRGAAKSSANGDGGDATDGADGAAGAAEGNDTGVLLPGGLDTAETAAGPWREERSDVLAASA